MHLSGMSSQITIAEEESFPDLGRECNFTDNRPGFEILFTLLSGVWAKGSKSEFAIVKRVRHHPPH